MKRNNNVDIIRGIAMLLVVLGHTISGTVESYENKFLYKIIWSLQLPLFFIISGYVTRYSKPIDSANSYFKYLKKRTLSYILPWIVWSFLVRGLILNQSYYYNFRHLLWHMDYGYWFLVSLWTIIIIYGLSDWLTHRNKPKSVNTSIIFHLVYSAIGVLLLSIIGYIVGFSFLSIKLSIYYMPLFMLGYIFGQIQTWLFKFRLIHIKLSVIYALALALWLFLIERINFINIPISINVIIARYATSIFGCISLIGILSTIYNNIQREKITVDFKKNLPIRLFNFLIWAGQNSLAIYLLHGFFLNLCLTSNDWIYMKGIGVPLLIANYLLCLSILIPVIKLLASNKFLNKILFWK